MTAPIGKFSRAGKSAPRYRIDIELDDDLAPVATPLEELLADGGEFAMTLQRVLAPRDVDTRGEMH